MDYCYDIWIRSEFNLKVYKWWYGNQTMVLSFVKKLFFDLLYQHDGGLFSYMLFVDVYFNCLSILVMWQYYYNLLQIKMILSYSFIWLKQTYMISERNVERQLQIPYSYRELYWFWSKFIHNRICCFIRGQNKMNAYQNHSKIILKLRNTDVYRY